MTEHRGERHKIDPGFRRARGERVPEIVEAEVTHARMCPRKASLTRVSFIGGGETLPRRLDGRDVLGLRCHVSWLSTESGAPPPRTPS